MLKFIDNTNQQFYILMGRFLANREVARELGMPVWDDADKQWVISVVKGEVLGFASYVITKNKVVLKSAYVLPEHRRKGVYTELLDARLAKVGTPGTVVEATVTRSSYHAMLSAGFETVAVKGKYYHMRKVF